MINLGCLESDRVNKADNQPPAPFGGGALGIMNSALPEPESDYVDCCGDSGIKVHKSEVGLWDNILGGLGFSSRRPVKKSAHFEEMNSWDRQTRLSAERVQKFLHQSCLALEPSQPLSQAPCPAPIRKASPSAPKPLGRSKPLGKGDFDRALTRLAKSATHAVKQQPQPVRRAPEVNFDATLSSLFGT